MFDHLVRMVEHYGLVKGNLQAGAVTYFAFLSFFPILALGFFVIGYVTTVYPEADKNLTDAIDNVLPGMVGEGNGQISLKDIQDSASTVGVIGLLGVLYAGLGWLSGMREALLMMFQRPPREKPNFFVGKAKDLVSLATIGLVMIVSVAVSSVISSMSRQILELVGLGDELSPLLTVITVVVGLAANMLLFYALFRLLADPQIPKTSLWSGALLGAIGFEVLKRLSAFLMASTKSQPAFQAFGIALILVVWINYFSRVVMYAASWAHTSKRARKVLARLEKEQAARERAQMVGSFAPGTAKVTMHGENGSKKAAKRGFAAGGASMLAAVAVVRRVAKR